MSNGDLIRLVVELIALSGGFLATIVTIKSEIRHLWKNLERVDAKSERAHTRLDQHIAEVHTT